MNKKVIWYLLLIFIIITVKTMLTTADTPTPHNVKGRVFHSDGSTGVQNGIPVLVNDTTNLDYVLTYTYAPPIPSMLGSYSTTISGNDNDNIIVKAWNKTHYGTNTSNLAPTTTDINVMINYTRPSELNITVIEPANNSLFNLSVIFNVTANITVIGGSNGTNCSAWLIFTNESIINITDDDLINHSLGNITLGSFNVSTWNVVGNNPGSANITIRASCDSDGENFDHVNIAYISNITIEDDIVPPVVLLESPANNSIQSNPTIIFKYNVTDYSNILNCSLIINDKINITNITVQKGVSQNFTQTLDIGDYNWSVNCTDNSSYYNNGTSGIYNLSIALGIPEVTEVRIEKPIILNPGTTKLVLCNATIADYDGAADINYTNATLYDINYGSGVLDDFNYHYTNGSCTNISTGDNQKNFTCSFYVNYFANNATWECEVTSHDINGYYSSGTGTTAIYELLALNISPLIIDYGNLNFENHTSEKDENISITNFGNIPINISLEGYARTEGDGLAMKCEAGNFTVGNERFAVTKDTAYGSMTNLSVDAEQIDEYVIDQRSDDVEHENDRNLTYWKLHVPGNAQGICNGTIIFRAVDSII